MVGCLKDLYLGGSGRGLPAGTVPTFIWRNWGKRQKTMRRWPGRESNRASPEYKSGVLAVGQTVG
jgi:hypothetical protein